MATERAVEGLHPGVDALHPPLRGAVAPGEPCLPQDGLRDRVERMSRQDGLGHLIGADDVPHHLETHVLVGLGERDREPGGAQRAHGAVPPVCQAQPLERLDEVGVLASHVAVLLAQPIKNGLEADVRFRARLQLSCKLGPLAHPKLLLLERRQLVLDALVAFVAQDPRNTVHQVPVVPLGKDGGVLARGAQPRQLLQVHRGWWFRTVGVGLDDRERLGPGPVHLRREGACGGLQIDRQPHHGPVSVGVAGWARQDHRGFQPFGAALLAHAFRDPVGGEHQLAQMERLEGVPALVGLKELRLGHGDHVVALMERVDLELHARRHQGDRPLVRVERGLEGLTLGQAVPSPAGLDHDAVARVVDQRQDPRVRDGQHQIVLRADGRDGQAVEHGRGLVVHVACLLHHLRDLLGADGQVDVGALNEGDGAVVDGPQRELGVLHALRPGVGRVLLEEKASVRAFGDGTAVLGAEARVALRGDVLGDPRVRQNVRPSGFSVRYGRRRTSGLGATGPLPSLGHRAGVGAGVRSVVGVRCAQVLCGAGLLGRCGDLCHGKPLLCARSQHGAQYRMGCYFLEPVP